MTDPTATPDETTSGETLHVPLGEESVGKRLDVFLGSAVEELSRSYAKRLIKEESVRVNGQVESRPSTIVKEGDRIEIDLPPPPPIEPEPEDLPLEIVYEDEDLVILNKASGMVVHPSVGHESGTVVNAVLFHCKGFQARKIRPVDDTSRPGIVHRLDRDTSGLMVVAKSPAAFRHLSAQVRAKSFDRRYCALVQGQFREDAGVIRATIGRSLSLRGRMAVTSVKAREAVTHFTVRERFGVASYVELRLETGRTHQIRVHLRFAGRPVLGDEIYGVTSYAAWKISLELRQTLEGLHGQALHAELLGIEHPATGKRIRFEAPPPDDFQQALDGLRALRDTGR